MNIMPSWPAPASVHAFTTTRAHELSPYWLEQRHTNRCILVEEADDNLADAAVTRLPNQVLAVKTADCLPILLSNRQGDEVAVIHAGWRGLVAHIIENTVAQMRSPAIELMAWIGPAICSTCFEVGEEVLTQYQQAYPFATDFFKPSNGKYLGNLPALAERILNDLSIVDVFQSNLCTVEQSHLYSYRRDAGHTGRMATVIWFTPTKENDHGIFK